MSRWCAGTSATLRGVARIDPFFKTVVRGAKYRLTTEDVIEICNSDNED